jgi:hypothetical protein
LPGERNKLKKKAEMVILNQEFIGKKEFNVDEGFGF